MGSFFLDCAVCSIPGASESQAKEDDLPYLEFARGISHYIHVTVNGREILANAIGVGGNVFDTVTLN